MDKTDLYHSGYIYLSDYFMERLPHVSSRAWGIMAMALCHIPKYIPTSGIEHCLSFKDMAEVLRLPKSYTVNSADGKANIRKLCRRLMDEWCGLADDKGDIITYPVMLIQLPDDPPKKEYERVIVNDWDFRGDNLWIQLNPDILPLISGLGGKNTINFTKVHKDTIWKLTTTYAWDIYALLACKVAHKQDYGIAYAKLFTKETKEKLGQSIKSYTSDAHIDLADGSTVTARKFNRTRWEHQVLDKALEEINGEHLQIIKQEYKGKMLWYSRKKKYGLLHHYALKINVNRNIGETPENQQQS